MCVGKQLVAFPPELAGPSLKGNRKTLGTSKKTEM